MSANNAETFTFKRSFLISLIIHFLLFSVVIFRPAWLGKTETFRPIVYRVNLVSLPHPETTALTPSQSSSLSPTSPPLKPPPSGPKIIEKTIPKKPKVTTTSSAPSSSTTSLPPASPRDHSQELAQIVTSIKKNLITRIESETSSELTIFSSASESGQSDPVFQKYLKAISEKIKSVWAYPSARPNRPTIIYLKIAKNGNIIEAKIESSSGDEAYDNSALRAVKKSHPLPPLPTTRYGEPLELGVRF